MEKTVIMTRLLILGSAILAMASAILPAEELDLQDVQPEGAIPVSDNSPNEYFLPHFRGRALTLDINARVIEQNQTVIWNESHTKTTIPGHPIGIKIVGDNIVVVAQFTPYVRRGAQKILVAQGQIWMDIPNQGMRYHTSMQAIPLEFGEPIYFFPLGPQTAGDTACIEVMLTLRPYEE